MTNQTIDQVFEQALLAQAAYADLRGAVGDAEEFRSALEQIPGMTSSMAAYIVANYEVVDHNSNEGLISYSGTLFKRLTADNAYIFANRGTESIVGDVVMADVVGIAFNGIARLQTAEMLAYWKKLTTPGYLETSHTTALLAQGVRVAGHSLGGHLATLFALRNTPATTHAFTYNGAGLGSVVAGTVESVAEAILDALDVSINSPLAHLITNIRGDQGPNFVSEFGAHLGSVDDVFIESSFNPIRLHSISNLTASLAFHKLFTLIDVGIDFATMNSILEGASHDAELSYERLSNAVSRTLGITAGGSEEGMDEVFQLINEHAPAPPIGYSVRSLTGLDGQTLESMVSSDDADALATRYAMVNGHSFAISGPDYGLGLYARNRFSTEYLRDRSLYLSSLLTRNADDSEYYGEGFLVSTARSRATTVFFDAPSQTELAYNAEAALAGLLLPQIQFGGEGSDSLFGGANADRLYGGVLDDAADVLRGGEGDDYLEGGGGDDTLDGGRGADTAVGGNGHDTYLFSTGDQFLRIIDSDGDGEIIVNGQSLAGHVVGASATSTVHQDASGNGYSLIGEDLSITLSVGGEIVIQSFANGALGIVLDAAEPIAPPASQPGWRTFVVDPSNPPTGGTEAQNGRYTAISWLSYGSIAGDSVGEEIEAGSRGLITDPNTYYEIHGGLGESILTGDDGFNMLVDDSFLFDAQGSDPEELRHLGSSVGDDFLDGGDGVDWLFSFGGNDHLVGGDDDSADLLVDNPDEVFGGTSWITQTGHSSNDRLEGGGGNDWLFGNGGNGHFEGGTGNDEIYGGAHDDTLIGGDGNDILSADTRLTAYPIIVSGLPGSLVYTPTADLIDGEQVLYGNDTLEGGIGNDTLFGGGGNDHLSGGDGVDRLQGDFMLGWSDLRQGLRDHAADPGAIHGNDNLAGGAGDDLLYGGGGDDVLHGGADDDFLFGEWDTSNAAYSLDAQYHGDDVLIGGGGADVAYGNGGNDRIDGDDGDDFLFGGQGDDELFGGAGADQLLGEAGKDVLRGGEGNDLIGGSEDDDQLYGDDGDDQLQGHDGNDYLEGGAGDDELFGHANDDLLAGGAGIDELQGGDGNDLLDGGAGNDLLFGNAGDDTYLITPGGGQDQITDTQGLTTLRFEGGIRASDVSLVWSSGSQAYFLDYGPSDYVFMSQATFSSIQSIEFAHDDSLTTHAIKQLFQPGTLSDHSVYLAAGVASSEVGFRRWNDDLLLTYSGAVPQWFQTANLATRGVVYEVGVGEQYNLAAGTQVLVLTNWYRGSPTAYLDQLRMSSGTIWNFTSAASAAPATFTAEDGATVLGGTAAADTMIGGSGDEILAAGDGADDLAGGTGNDLLFGGKGDDTFHVEANSESDLIFDTAGSDDAIVFGAAIAPEDLTLTEQANGLLVQIGNTLDGNEVLILDWTPEFSPIERFVFANTTEWDQDAIEAHITGNRLPRAVNAIQNQVAGQGIAFSFIVPADIFADPDVGDQLSYSASYLGGTLPSWLTFDPNTREFAGTRPVGHEIPLSLEVVATDPSGATASAQFVLRAGLTAGDDNVTGGAADEEFFGMTGNDVIDGGGGEDYLDGGEGGDIVRGSAGDDILVGSVGDDRFEGGTGADTYVFTELAGEDRLLDTVGYDRIEFALGSDITIDDVTRTRIGNDLRISIGADALTVEGWYDGGSIDEVVFYVDGLPYIYDVFQIGDPFGTGDTRPYAGMPAPQWVVSQNQPFSFQVPVNFFTDIESQGTLTFATSTLPAWLTFDPLTRTISGTAPVTGSPGSTSFTIFANDGVNGPQGSAFLILTRPNLQVIEGNSGDDELIGTAAHDHIIAGAGADVIQAGAGDNIIDAGAGDDVVTSSGADRIFGGAGNDHLSGTSNHLRVVDGGAGDDHLDFGNVNGTYRGGFGDDYIQGGQWLLGEGGNDELHGSNNADTIEGGDDDDFIDGASGNDSLVGGSGNDTLWGAGGADSISGSDGDDVIDGGQGNDDLRGGAGDDRYVGFTPLTGNDVIFEGAGFDTLEFSSTVDTLIGSLSVIDAGSDMEIQLSGVVLSVDLVFDVPVIEEFVLYASGLPYRYSAAQMMGLASGINVGPAVNANLANAELSIDQPYSLALPANLFTDAESQQTLSYAATKTDGTPLPSWLVFDSGLRTLAGTPSASDAGVLRVRISATDGGGLSAATGLWLDVAATHIDGTSGDDTLNGTAAGEVISGSDGNDIILAQAGDDVVHGGDGDDELDGESGADYLAGGAGNDTYYYDHAADLAVELAAEGHDRVISSVDLGLPENVEDLVLVGGAIAGQGNRLANELIGNSSDNTLEGGHGDDVLDGGAGNDILDGGAGADTYFVDSASDVVLDTPDGDGDTIRSTVSWTLSENIENLVLLGTANINATGSDGYNVLLGNAGNNVLTGGEASDDMRGGLGDDTYNVDDEDQIFEGAGEGTDTVRASFDYVLGANFENLILTGFSGFSGTGNELDNTLTGNSGANTLTGGDGNDVLNGGSGSDTMAGGQGNDVYVVAQSADVVVENAGEGTDLVQSSITYTLGSDVENLTLTGSSQRNGTGNSLDNVLTGNSASNTLTGDAGNDVLDGAGGTDTMVGGLGDDVYFVNVSGDVTTETAGQGIDTLNSTVTRTLAANIELLFLMGGSAVNGTGNSLANLLRGNGVNNTLAGGGGTDILEGGGGNDTLSNTSGNSLMNGGDGTDTLTGTGNHDLLVGGAGNDALTTGSGADIIAFNLGGGQDTVAVSATQDNTLSLGGGILYADLLFEKSGNNLILKSGALDRVTFTNYYASASNRSVDKLQIVIEGTSDYDGGSADVLRNKFVQTFDFDGLVSAFDTARGADPGLTSWALTNALLAQHLSSSDTAAIGGDLAYRYGRYGSLGDISYTPALSILAAGGFGTSAQTLQSLSNLQDSSARLAA